MYVYTFICVNTCLYMYMLYTVHSIINKSVHLDIMYIYVKFARVFCSIKTLAVCHTCALRPALANHDRAYSSEGIDN